MQYGNLDWILEQKKDIRGKTGEVSSLNSNAMLVS